MTKDKLFDKKFVYFMWDDRLDGKDCFVSDDINELQQAVEAGIDADTVHRELTLRSIRYPFTTSNDSYRFAYYDPNYSAKRAYNEGKQIQFLNTEGEWLDCRNTPDWNDETEYRIAPMSSRMTYRQLAEWLAKGNGQCKTSDVAVTHLGYDNIDEKDNRELPDEYKIRPWGSDEWIEPTFDVYSEDCEHD